jgi:hypothetical protein
MRSVLSRCWPKAVCECARISAVVGVARREFERCWSRRNYGKKGGVLSIIYNLCSLCFGSLDFDFARFNDVAVMKVLST